MRASNAITRRTLTPAMTPLQPVAVSGMAITPFNRRKDSSSFRDWAFSACQKALAQSTLAPADIEALFVASESDFFTLQLNPASILASDNAIHGAATTRVEGGGASGQLAVHAAVRAIQSGAYKHVAVIGVDPSASQLPADAVRTLYGYSFDAWHDGMTGVSATALYALSYQLFADKHKTRDAHLAKVTITNRSNAMLNPNAHLGRTHTAEEINDSPVVASPYRRLHCSPLSDGAAAMILSGTNALPVERRHAAQIVGIGAASDHAHLGSRKEPGNFAAKTLAMQRACNEAGITPHSIELAEVYDAYAGAQLQALMALGLSHDLLSDIESEKFTVHGECPVNPSGGLLGQGAPVGATGVAQTISCAMQIEGKYHSALQRPTPPDFAVADTHGGVCTTSAVTILSGAP